MKRTQKLLSLLLAVLMLFSTVVFTVTSCGDSSDGNDSGSQNGGSNDGEKPDQGNKPDGGNGNGNTDTPDDNNSVKRTVKISTKGGMALSSLPVYCYTYEDGELVELVDFLYTDANGVVEFNLEKDVDYAVSIIDNIPDGYDVNEFYPIVGANLNIVLESSLIDGEIAGKTLELGDIMYDFTLTNIDGTEYKLSDALKGKDMVLLNFWYTTCSWCITEFPYMETVYNEYKEDIAIAAIDPYPTDTAADIKNFLADFELSGTPLTFDFLHDNTATVGSAFAVSAYPTSVVIDRYGMVAMIHEGAITSERQFRIIFDHFTGDDYEQIVVRDPEQITPVVKPDVTQPSSSQIGAVLNGSNLDVTYTPDKSEYSWPFIITEKDGVSCIAPANGGRNIPDSFAIIYANVYLEKGDALALDYFTSTEKVNDNLYVLVDGKDIYSISGLGDSWETCYPYVALESGYYELSLCYMKDDSVDAGEDNVYIKNLRIISSDDIAVPSYIYRFAATNPDDANIYQDFSEIFYNESDGYYHVNSVVGPILLADLMGYSRFDDTTSIYYIAVDLYEKKLITAAQYDKIIEYCNYASNSNLNGVCSVNKELADILKLIAQKVGNSGQADEWLEICCYYDAYGSGGKQLEDPIKGLATFSAYPVIEGGAEAGDNTPVQDVFPNAITYNRLIMPRGLLYKFTPTVSGTYRIASYSEYEANAWIFRTSDVLAREQWFTYENVYRETEVRANDNNVYIIAYLEAGVDYYIDIAYYDVYQYGTIYFRVERLTSQDGMHPNGEGYYRFSSASPGFFTYYENENTGSLDTNEIVAGGISVELNDGYWREKRNDGRVGSLLYADFTMTTGIFNRTIEQMIEAKAFDFSRTEYDQYVLNVLDICGGDKNACIEYLQNEWGTDYDTYYDIYQVDDVLAGRVHGSGADYTAIMREYVKKEIKVGYNEILGETIAEGDVRLGCVIVDAQLAEILQLLMDKYTFEGVDNSWTKVCYYTQYFCAATPV